MGRLLCSLPPLPLLDTVVGGCDARSCGSHLATRGCQPKDEHRHAKVLEWKMQWTERLRPSDLYVEILTLDVMVLGVRAFWGVVRS